MEQAKPKFYLTTPIYYTNGLPHIGHTYTTVVADTVRRYKRMQGYEVVMTTGTDEHGVNVERAAQKAGVPESEFVAQMAEAWRALWEELGVPADEFIRTTEVRHARTVQWLFKLFRENGFVYPGHYTGQYCIYDNAYVDVKPGENCPDCGRPTETVTEENYFFKLSAFEKPLLDLYKKNPTFIQPETRRNEILSFVEGGLRDLSITRTSIRWGIPVPGEEPHVFYVWFDALTAYLSAVGGPEYDRRGFWPADLHLVGKDIIRFHAVYWPAFLMAAGLPLPKQVWAHGWFLIDAGKMSKSKGNVVLPRPIAQVLGMDALRYYMLRETVFGQDGNFSFDALVTRYNADLANGIGNLSNRTLTMIQQYCGGRIPQPTPGHTESSANTLRTMFRPTIRMVVGNAESGDKGHYNTLQFSSALQDIARLVSHVDAYLVQEKPWVLAKDEAQKQRLADVLYDSAEALRIITVLAHPVLPEATKEIWKQLGQPGTLEEQRIDQVDWGQLKSGTRIGTIQAVFPRMDHQEAIGRMETVESETQKPAAAPAASDGTVASPSGAAAQTAPDKIAIEDFAKVEMRVGQIKTAERIVGADKLLKLTVDIGSEVRQICAGIAQFYEPESLVGRKVVVVVNLAPRKLRGVESNGMIVAASVGPEGRPVLAAFTEDVEVGARLK
jgi:methionyl-tRNA synthetase